MSGIYHLMGADLVLSASGDLAVVDGAGATTQRVQRRLLTNPGDYVWQAEYGGGLAAMVGAVARAPSVQAVIRGQMLLEGSVARTPLPTVAVLTSADGSLRATITYADAATGVLQRPSVAIGNN